jgi:hypothetical protein
VWGSVNPCIFKSSPPHHCSVYASYLGCSVLHYFVAAALIQKAPDVPGEHQIDLCCWPITGNFFSIKKGIFKNQINPPNTVHLYLSSFRWCHSWGRGGERGGEGGAPQEYKFHLYRTKEMKLPKFSLNPIQALVYIRIAHSPPITLNVRTKTH